MSKITLLSLSVAWRIRQNLVEIFIEVIRVCNLGIQTNLVFWLSELVSWFQISFQGKFMIVCGLSCLCAHFSRRNCQRLSVLDCQLRHFFWNELGRLLSVFTVKNGDCVLIIIVVDRQSVGVARGAGVVILSVQVRALPLAAADAAAT